MTDGNGARNTPSESVYVADALAIVAFFGLVWFGVVVPFAAHVFVLLLVPPVVGVTLYPAGVPRAAWAALVLLGFALLLVVGGIL